MAEPGELAEKFLQSVKFGLLSRVRGRNRKEASAISKVLNLADLVAYRPYFQVGGILHRYIGRQTHVCALVFYLIVSIFINKQQIQLMIMNLSEGIRR